MGPQKWQMSELFTITLRVCPLKKVLEKSFYINLAFHEVTLNTRIAIGTYSSLAY